jgi:hypothetical protein
MSRAWTLVTITNIMINKVKVSELTGVIVKQERKERYSGLL